MRLLSWILKLALFIAALGFALFNTAPVDLHFFGSAVSWSAPLVIFLLLFFAAGAAFGLSRWCRRCSVSAASWAGCAANSS